MPSPRTSRSLRAAAAIALAAAALAGLSGCLANGSTTVRQTGRYVGEESISKIVPGETTGEWVLAAFGEPTERQRLADGRTEIWRWVHTSRVKSSGGVFLLVQGSSDAERTTIAVVEVVDGVVQRAWMDGSTTGRNWSSDAEETLERSYDDKWDEPRTEPVRVDGSGRIVSE